MTPEEVDRLLRNTKLVTAPMKRFRGGLPGESHLRLSVLVPWLVAAGAFMAILVFLALPTPPETEPARPEESRPVNGLRLSLELDTEGLAYMAQVTGRAIFENVSGQEVVFHEPQFASMDGFPDLILRKMDGSYDGEVLKIFVPSYQTKTSSGMLGRLIRLTPGETYVSKISIKRIQSEVPFIGVPLQPGWYGLQSRYEKSDTQVDFSPAFTFSEDPGDPGLLDLTGRKKMIPDLWTGLVDSRLHSFRVNEPTDVAVFSRVPAGNRKVIELVFTNPTPRVVEVTLGGTITIGRAFPKPVRSTLGTDNSLPAISLGAGKDHVVRIDLEKLKWALHDDESGALVPLNLPDRGIAYCTLDLSGTSDGRSMKLLAEAFYLPLKVE